MSLLSVVMPSTNDLKCGRCGGQGDLCETHGLDCDGVGCRNFRVCPACRGAGVVPVLHISNCSEDAWGISLCGMGVYVSNIVAAEDYELSTCADCVRAYHLEQARERGESNAK